MIDCSIYTSTFCEKKKKKQVQFCLFVLVGVKYKTWLVFVYCSIVVLKNPANYKLICSFKQKQVLISRKVFVYINKM